MTYDNNRKALLSMRSLTYCFAVVFLFAAAVIVQPAASQITIRADDFTSLIGESSNVATFTSEDAAELQVAVDATGENQTYDFTNAAVSDTMRGSVTYHGSPEGLPGADDFAQSNFIIALQLGDGVAAEDSTVWIYSLLESDALYSLGGSYVFRDPNTGDEDTLSFAFDPPELDMPLPLTYGDAWSDTTNTFGVESITEAAVEGWGTLVTPWGSYQALRIRYTETTNIVGFQDQSHWIEFIAGTRQASVSLFLEDDGETASYADISTWSIETASESDELPQQVHLEQNYPNPFNPATTLSYELDASRHVRLTVHDMLGRTVAVLVDGVQTAGAHNVAFNAADLPSGAYTYRLQTDVGTQTRAMVLTK